MTRLESVEANKIAPFRRMLRLKNFAELWIIVFLTKFKKAWARFLGAYRRASRVFRLSSLPHCPITL